MRIPNRSTAVRAVILALCLACLASTYRALSQSQHAQAAPKPRTPPPPEARIDINHASTAELLKVPGMTQTWAGRIIRFRPYRTKQDLLDRGVLPSNVYDRIKDNVIAHRDSR